MLAYPFVLFHKHTRILTHKQKWGKMGREFLLLFVVVISY